MAAEALGVGVFDTKEEQEFCASIGGAEYWTRRGSGKGVDCVVAGEQSACDNLDCLTLHDASA